VKIRHRIPPEALHRSEPISERYQAEVDAATGRGERRYRDAQRRLERAEAKLVKAEWIKAKPQREHAILVARVLVELARQELLALQRAMSYSPASAEHRGTGRHRPVVPMSTL